MGAKLDVWWDWLVVLQSIGMAFMGSYSAVTLTELYRVSRRVRTRFFGEHSVLLLNSLAVGGAAIWCMHFIGMGALHLRAPDGEDIPVYFNTGVTILSLIAPIICIWVAMYISTRDSISVIILTKDEICAYLSKETNDFKLLRSPTVLLRLFLLKNIPPLMVAGFITGVGVLIMHYVGMAAMKCDAIIHWDYGLVALTVVVAVSVSFVAYWILFRLLSLRPTEERLRVASAIVMTVAVCAVHYLGMVAATYEYAPGRAGMRLGAGDITRYDATKTALNLGVTFNVFVAMACQAELRSCYYPLLGFESVLQYMRRDPELPRSDYLKEYQGMREDYMQDLSEVLQTRKKGGCFVTDSTVHVEDLEAPVEKMFELRQALETRN